MAVQASKLSAHPVEPAEVRETLARLLGSRYFANAHKKKQFLRVICDFYLNGRAEELNEYLLAYDVFGRDPAYQPSADPIVRVVAHEIRKKLEAYYQAEGAGDEIRLEIPAGSYQPVFKRQVTAPKAENTAGDYAAEGPTSARAARPALRALLLILALTVAGLSLLTGLLFQSNRDLRERIAQASRGADPALAGETWKTFLDDSSPPVVVLSNPLVPRFSSDDEPEVIRKDSVPVPAEAVTALREKTMRDPELLRRAPVATENALPAPGGKAWTAPRRPPALILSNSFYTGLGEAIGLHHLTSFFRLANRPIVLKQSRTLSAEDIKNHNVILLGGSWVNEWSGKLPDHEDFVYTNSSTIVNLNPQAGEEREYKPRFDARSGNLLVDYALITLKPNLTEGNKVMVLSGIYSQGTEAAAEFVTSTKHLEQLNRMLSQKKSVGESGNFQALLKVGVENGIPTVISILALHELK